MTEKVENTKVLFCFLLKENVKLIGNGKTKPWEEGFHSSQKPKLSEKIGQKALFCLNEFRVFVLDELHPSALRKMYGWNC